MCGVKFGTPYETAKLMLINKFGNPDVEGTENSVLCV